MPMNDMMHTVHQLSEYNENFIDNKYELNGEHYAYGSNKRKRKTTTPQKRDHLDERYTEKLKPNLRTPSLGPINLVTKENYSFNSPTDSSVNCCDKSVNAIENNNLEQMRLYTAILNYFLLKYKLPNDSKCENQIHCSTTLNGYRPTDKNSGNTFTGNATNFLAGIQAQHSSQMGETIYSQCNSVNTTTAESAHNYNTNDLKSITFKRSGTDFHQIFSAFLNSYLTSVPLPKPNYANYDRLVVCYKNVIEKAYSLQHSVEVYLNMIQNLLSLENLSNDQSTEVGSISSLRNLTYDQTSCKVAVPSQSLINLPSYSNSHLTATLNDIYHSKPTTMCIQNNSGDHQRMPNLIFDQQNFYQYENQSNNCLQSPVDLTNTDKPQLSCSDISTNSKENNSQCNEKSSEEKQFDYHAFESPRHCELDPRVEYERIPSTGNSNDLQFGLDDDKTFIQNVNIRHKFMSQNPKHANNTMLCNSLLTCNQRTNFAVRKKSYFKSKRSKKAFGINSTTNSGPMNSDGISTKKSNFRGTSEEENKVAPNFKPIEVNGQILLSDVYPNVTLSKDIFYSLIVKASGSATRLIRLLMKSFFTQNELAASSLSGEGIYKQRLEPNVTEAIKIFIRQRHPQLKTGSINLCMTDVCVQARRVANNQRSRQYHPVQVSPTSSAHELLLNNSVKLFDNKSSSPMAQSINLPTATALATSPSVLTTTTTTTTTLAMNDNGDSLLLGLKNRNSQAQRHNKTEKLSHKLEKTRLSVTATTLSSSSSSSTSTSSYSISPSTSPQSTNARVITTVSSISKSASAVLDFEEMRNAQTCHSDHITHREVEIEEPALSIADDLNVDDASFTATGLSAMDTMETEC